MGVVNPSGGLTPDEGGAGGWVLLADAEGNGTAAIEIENVFSDTFDKYIVTIAGFQPSGNTSRMQFRFMDGSTQIDGAVYNFGWIFGGSVGNPSDGELKNFTEFDITNQDMLSTDFSQIIITLDRLDRTGPLQFQATWQATLSYQGGSDDKQIVIGGGLCDTTPQDGIRLFPELGTINAGYVTVYGVTK